MLPYDRELPQIWAQIRTDGERRGRSISVNDCWVAATAVHYDIPLVTNNRSDFEA